MGIKKFRFEVVKGETEHISYAGKRTRRPTVLIRVGSLSFSKKAFLLGAALVICQLLDGLLTYLGLSLMGVHMEGNMFLRELMHVYGISPVLFVAKSLAVVLAVMLAFHAHRRRWIRPIIGALVFVYLGLAVVPWTHLIVNRVNAPKAAPTNEQPTSEYAERAKKLLSTLEK